MGFWTLWESDNRYAGEDERLALTNRFIQEGLDVQLLTDSQKLLHVWRWLVDAESNCLSLRRQIDKLHRQHEQDLKEVEEYLEHVWKLSNERLKQLETENKSLKKQIISNNNKNNELKGNSINCLVKHNNNLCDSLKLKSSLKQIIQNANGDNNNDYNNENSLKTNKTINSFNSNENIRKSTSRRRNTIQSISDSDNNNLFNEEKSNKCNDNYKSDEQLQAMQEICQQFKHIINQLEDKIIGLEKLNRSLEIENETLSYKLSESQSQSDQLEHQLLKLSDKRVSLSPSRTPADEVNHTSEQTLESLQLLLASRLSVTAQSDTTLVKQLHDLKSDNQRLDKELHKRSHELQELLQKYNRRKTRHKEMITRLRSYTERENRGLQQLVNSMDYKYKLAEEELQKHKKYCLISDITAINDME